MAYSFKLSSCPNCSCLPKDKCTARSKLGRQPLNHVTHSRNQALEGCKKCLNPSKTCFDFRKNVEISVGKMCHSADKVTLIVRVFSYPDIFFAFEVCSLCYDKEVY